MREADSHVDRLAVFQSIRDALTSLLSPLMAAIVAYVFVKEGSGVLKGYFHGRNRRDGS